MPDRYGDEPTTTDPDEHVCNGGWLNDRMTADNPRPCPVCKPTLTSSARRSYLRSKTGRLDPAQGGEPFDWSGRRQVGRPPVDAPVQPLRAAQDAPEGK